MMQGFAARLETLFAEIVELIVGQRGKGLAAAIRVQHPRPYERPLPVRVVSGTPVSQDPVEPVIVQIGMAKTDIAEAVALKPGEDAPRAPTPECVNDGGAGPKQGAEYQHEARILAHQVGVGIASARGFRTISHYFHYCCRHAGVLQMRWLRPFLPPRMPCDKPSFLDLDLVFLMQEEGVRGPPAAAAQCSEGV